MPEKSAAGRSTILLATQTHIRGLRKDASVIVRDRNPPAPLLSLRQRQHQIQTRFFALLTELQELTASHASRARSNAQDRSCRYRSNIDGVFAQREIIWQITSVRQIDVGIARISASFIRDTQHRSFQRPECLPLLRPVRVASAFDAAEIHFQLFGEDLRRAVGLDTFSPSRRRARSKPMIAVWFWIRRTVFVMVFSRFLRRGWLVAQQVRSRWPSFAFRF